MPSFSEDERPQARAARTKATELLADLGAAAEASSNRVLELQAARERDELWWRSARSRLVWFGASFLLFTTLGRIALSAGGLAVGAAYAWAARGPVQNIEATTVVFAFGVLLFLFRKYRRHQYGAAEVGAGMATASTVLASSHDATTQTIAVVGAIFVIVRGLDNVESGMGDGLVRDLRTLSQKVEEEKRAREVDRARNDEILSGFRARFAEVQTELAAAERSSAAHSKDRNDTSE